MIQCAFDRQINKIEITSVSSSFFFFLQVKVYSYYSLNATMYYSYYIA